MGIFIIVWVVKLSASYYKLFNPSRAGKSDDDPTKKALEFIANYVSLATGIILSSIRFNEPFFKYLVKEFTYSCFG